MIESPSFEEPLRIISDLHFGHPASIVHGPEALTPLFEGVKAVVFNGDTVELRYLRGRELGLRNAVLIRDACIAAGARPVFLNGNHDPVLSELCHADLAGGAILVTHGDMLFHNISPWSHQAGIMADAHTRELAAFDPDALNNFEKRLKASKRAALSIELRKSGLRRGSLAKLRTVLREGWPPWRPFQIFHAWAVTPERARLLLQAFRPNARFIIIGHTHFPGVWERDGRIVINTGGYFPLSKRLTVELRDGKVIVRNVIFSKGQFRPAGTVCEFPATPLS
jgi:predicted phosphodiesterase